MATILRSAQVHGMHPAPSREKCRHPAPKEGVLAPKGRSVGHQKEEGLDRNSRSVRSVGPPKEEVLAPQRKKCWHCKERSFGTAKKEVLAS